MYSEKTRTEDSRNVIQPNGDLPHDFVTEVRQEVNEIKGTGDVANPSQSDVLVQKHVTGLAISFFILIALILLAAIGGIYWYAQSNHKSQRSGPQSTAMSVGFNPVN
jgi:hypothetical protein